MNKQELIKKATEAGFINANSPGQPTWYSDIIQNQNIMLYLVTTQNK